MADAPIKQLSPKQRLNSRLHQMKTERQSFVDHWRELSQYIQPRRGRFFIQDRNKGDKRYQSIINSAATRAKRIAQAGMFAGVMSPTRPWFRLETFDQDLMEHAPVKEWLEKVGIIERTIFNDSNLYNMSPVMIGELLTFGTGGMLHVDDFNTVARFYAQTIGSYMIALNDKLTVDTFCREYEMTCYQMVAQFGLKRCSQPVRTAYDFGNYDAWFPVVHTVMPNSLANPTNPMSRNKPFVSTYYEPGERGASDPEFLSESGFDEFPGYFPRWETAGEDVYGTDCPGMMALGDIKGLQIGERRKAQGVDLMVHPAMKGPPSLRESTVSQLPGGLTMYDPGDGSREGLTPIYEVRLPINELRMDLDAIERRINDAFFVDLFLAITNMEGIQPRNQLDILQRHEERLLQIGPVLEQLHGEFLSPLVNRTFNQMTRAKIIPPPPEELQGQELQIRFVSTLAMAQQAVATGSIEKLSGFVFGLAAGGAVGALDKFDADQAIDEYARAIGAPARVVVPDDRVAQIRAAREQERQQERALAAAQSAANTGKMMADTKTGDEANMMTDMRRGVGGQ